MLTLTACGHEEGVDWAWTGLVQATPGHAASSGHTSLEQLPALVCVRERAGELTRAAPAAAAPAAADALRSEEGDVLCFLPGVGEIRNTQRRLQELLPAGAQRSTRVLPLHGNLSAQQQDQAIRCAACCALACWLEP